jgi:hypothetical protein
MRLKNTSPLLYISSYGIISLKLCDFWIMRGLAKATLKYELKYIHYGVCNKLAKTVIVLNFSAFLDRLLLKFSKNSNFQIGPKLLLMNHQLPLCYTL